MHILFTLLVSYVTREELRLDSIYINYSFILNYTSGKDETFYDAAKCLPKILQLSTFRSFVSETSHNFTWPHLRSAIFFPFPSGISLVYNLLPEERHVHVPKVMT